MSVAGESAIPAKVAAGGVVCGSITATAIGVILGSLDKYQVPGFADMDGTIGLAGALVASVVAVVLIAAVGVLGGRRLGIRRSGGHALAALILIPAAVVPLVIGGERNRFEAGLIWGTASVCFHVALAYALARGRWQRWMAVGLVMPCTAAALATWGSQHRWRAQKFEAVRVPLVVPDIPGYQLTGTWAGHHTISMALRRTDGRRLYAIVGHQDPGRSDCMPGSDRPRTLPPPESGQGPEQAMFCLRDNAALTLVARDGSARLADLLPVIAVREVDGSELADYPDDNTMSEPD